MTSLRRFTSMGAAFLLVGACANSPTTTLSPAQTARPTAVIPAASSAGVPANPSAPAGARQPFVIHIRNYAYTPSAPVVAVGQPIEIINDDDVAHTWSSAPKAGWTFTSGNLDKGQRASFPGFGKPGTYTFVCFYHAEMPSMTGVTTVMKAP